jgi:hypothetical protein
MTLSGMMCDMLLIEKKGRCVWVWRGRGRKDVEDV